AQLVSALKEGGRGTSGGASLQRTRAALTVAEVALAVVLLAESGLLIRSFARLTAVDPGFQPSNVIAGMVSLPRGKYASIEQARVTLDQLLAKVRAIPGVESATLGSDLPICCSEQSTISFASRPDQSKPPLLNIAVVDPEYFETLQIPFVGGRHIETGDRAERATGGAGDGTAATRAGGGGPGRAAGAGADDGRGAGGGDGVAEVLHAAADDFRGGGAGAGVGGDLRRDLV